MPSAEELESSGLTLEDFDGDEVELWPENGQAFELFVSLGTQWRTGIGGATGLDYAVLYPLLDRADGDWQQLFDDVRVLESAALAEIRKK